MNATARDWSTSNGSAGNVRGHLAFCRRYRLAFSLAAVALAVAGLCVVATGLSHRRYVAIRALERRGVSVQAVPRGASWIPYWTGLGRLWPFEDVVAVYFVNAPATDGDMVHLEALPNLQVVTLLDTAVTDAGLASLRDHTRLRYLILNGNPIGDAGLEELAGLTRLESLSLERTEVTDAGLRHLRRLSSLRRIRLTGTRISKQAIRELRRARPTLIIEGVPNAGQPTLGED